MLKECRKSCGTCDVTDETELYKLIQTKISKKIVDDGEVSLLETPYGVAQNIDPEKAEQIQEVIRNFTSYMEDFVFQDPKYQPVKDTCRNRNPFCAFWVTIGECEKVRTTHAFVFHRW